MLPDLERLMKEFLTLFSYLLDHLQGDYRSVEFCYARKA